MNQSTLPVLDGDLYEVMGSSANEQDVCIDYGLTLDEADAYLKDVPVGWAYRIEKMGE